MSDAEERAAYPCPEKCGHATCYLPIVYARAERLENALREIVRRADVVETPEEIVSIATRALKPMRPAELTEREK